MLICNSCIVVAEVLEFGGGEKRGDCRKVEGKVKKLQCGQITIRSMFLFDLMVKKKILLVYGAQICILCMLNAGNIITYDTTY